MRVWLLAVGMLFGTGLAALADPVEDFVELHGFFATARDELPEISGIEGEWLAMTLLLGSRTERTPDHSEVEDYLNRFCGEDRATARLVKTISDRSLLIETLGPQRFEERLDWIGGRRFARSFDTDALVKHLFGDAFPAPDPAYQLWLNTIDVPREVDLYTPTPDILVIEGNGLAQTFVRCP